MSATFMHPSYGFQPPPSLPRREATTESPFGLDWAAIRQARSCCCPSPPAIIAVLPPAAGRTAPTELLFCRHHFRAARAALAVRGATPPDMSGRLFGTESSVPPARSPHGEG